MAAQIKRQRMVEEEEDEEKEQRRKRMRRLYFVPLLSLSLTSASVL